MADAIHPVVRKGEVVLSSLHRQDPLMHISEEPAHLGVNHEAGECHATPNHEDRQQRVFNEVTPDGRDHDERHHRSNETSAVEHRDPALLAETF